MTLKKLTNDFLITLWICQLLGYRYDLFFFVIYILAVSQYLNLHYWQGLLHKIRHHRGLQLKFILLISQTSTDK